MVTRGGRRLSDFASRYSLNVLMVGLISALVFYAVYDLCFNPAYPIGDWLINYSDGFVRRGLFGQIILLAAHVAHMPPAWMVVVFQAALYTAFLCGVYRLAAPLRRDVLWYCMMFSPAALALMILAPFNALRKEMLAPMALTATIFLLRRRLHPAALSISIATLIAIMVLSHDALFCCFPYFFAAVAVATEDLKYTAKICGLPAVVAAFLMNLTRTHLGDSSVAIAVCRSVGGRWIDHDDTRNLCAGAIRHLSWTFAMSRHEAVTYLYYWPLYAVLIVPSLAPFILALVRLYKRDGLHFEVKVIAWIAALCALLSTPLFYATVDWGRWIQMQVLCLLLMILMVAQNAKSFLPDPASTPIGQGRWWRAPLLVVAFLYCTCWTLPILGLQSVRFGYLSLPRNFVREFRIMRGIRGWQTIDRGW